MAKHAWSLLCKESRIDADTNLLTIVDIFEGLVLDKIDGDTAIEEAIKAKGSLTLPVPFEITHFFYRDDLSVNESIEVKIVEIAPSGKELYSSEFRGEIIKGNTGLRMRIKSENLGIEGEGIHMFNVYLKSANKFSKVASLPLSIKFANRER